MQDRFVNRLYSLIKEGGALRNDCDSYRRQSSGTTIVSQRTSQEERQSGRSQFDEERTQGANLLVLKRAWLTSVVNLLQNITPPNSSFRKERQKILNGEEHGEHISDEMIDNLFGLLKSVMREWGEGTLEDVEFFYAAETFDDFLEHAYSHHKANRLKESAVLASAVLEDTLKKIAKKHAVTGYEKMSLEPLLDSLKKMRVINPTTAKRLKGHVSIRNAAFHADWNKDKFNISDVGKMITEVRELIERHL